MDFKDIYHFFNNPRTALLIILLFLLGYFLTQGFAAGFGNNFLEFGPTTDEIGNPVSFMGINLDNWTIVSIVYVIVFITTVLNTYYNAIGTNLRTFVWNTGSSKVPFSKFWTYILLILDPIIRSMLYIIQFYATATFQLQYIIPQIVASYFTNLPFTLKWLSGKKFIG